MSLAAKEAETRLKNEDADADADVDADADGDADADADGEEDMHLKAEEEDGDDDNEMTPSLKAEEEDENDSVVHSIKGEDGIVVPKLKRSASSLDEDARLAAELDARLAAELHAQWNGGRPSRRGKQVPKTTPKKKKSRKKSDELVNPESRKPEKKKRKVNPNSPFNAPLILSEPLSNLLGEAQLSRPETVKRIWQYVKERNLQDPDDRRYILCDDSMKPIFGNKIHMLYVFLCLPSGGVSLSLSIYLSISQSTYLTRVCCSTMNKVLAQNMYKPEEKV